jgi:hypothetical protein
MGDGECNGGFGKEMGDAFYRGGARRFSPVDFESAVLLLMRCFEGDMARIWIKIARRRG